MKQCFSDRWVVPSSPDFVGDEVLLTLTLVFCGCSTPQCPAHPQGSAPPSLSSLSSACLLLGQVCFARACPAEQQTGQAEGRASMHSGCDAMRAQCTLAISGEPKHAQ